MTSPGSRLRRLVGSLFWRVYLHGLVLLALVALAVGLVGAALRHSSDLPPRVERAAAWLGDRVAEAWTDPARLQREISGLADAFSVAISVHNPDGSVRASSRTPPDGRPTAEQRAHLAAGESVRVEGTHFTFGAPARGTGGGYVLVMPRRGPNLAGAAAVLGAVLLVLALGSLPLARSITRPIEHLTRTARALGEGDLNARARLPARGETGELAGAFDQMAERIQTLVRGERELLANVSHELRTPLARIRVALELASEGDVQRSQRYLSEIGADLGELDRLIEEVLATARLDLGSGRLPFHPQRLAPAAVVDDAVARFQAAHPERLLDVHCDASLPALQGDPVLLRRLLANLLDNARKYSEPASPIRVWVQASLGDVQFAVRDHGIGIDKGDLGRVFEPFFRTDRSRARGTGGVGLGLALSRRIVEAHGGTIEADSTPGAFTTVYVRIPAAPPETAVREEAPATARSS